MYIIDLDKTMSNLLGDGKIFALMGETNAENAHGNRQSEMPGSLKVKS